MGNPFKKPKAPAPLPPPKPPKPIPAQAQLVDLASEGGGSSNFEAELKKFPKSADFNFEKYYSRSLLISEHDPEYIIKLWKDCKEAVYACDPLYNMNVPAKNSKDLYFYGLFAEGKKKSKM